MIKSKFSVWLLFIILDKLTAKVNWHIRSKKFSYYQFWDAIAIGFVIVRDSVFITTQYSLQKYVDLLASQQQFANGNYIHAVRNPYIHRVSVWNIFSSSLAAITFGRLVFDNQFWVAIAIVIVTRFHKNTVFASEIWWLNCHLIRNEKLRSSILESIRRIGIFFFSFLSS